MRKTKSYRKIIITSIGAGALVVAGIVLFFVWQGSKGQDTSGMTMAQSSVVERGDINNAIEGTGSLEVADSSVVQIPKGLVIEKIKVQNGQAVKTGDVIATVTKASVASELLTVREQIEEVEENIDDLDDDETSDTDSVEYLEKLVLEAELVELQSNEELLNAIMEKGNIIAPTTGTIADLNIVEGSSVEAAVNSSNNSSSSNNNSSNSNSPGASFMSTYSVLSSNSVKVTRLANDNEEIPTPTPEITITPTPGLTQTPTAEPTKVPTTKPQSTPNPKPTVEPKSTPTPTVDLPPSTTPNQEGTSPGTGNMGNVGVVGNTGNTGNPQSQGIPQTSTDSEATANSSKTSTSANSLLTTIATIGNNEVVEVSINVDELDILTVEKGQGATVTLDAVGGEKFEGTVMSISSEASQGDSSVKYSVGIEMAKTDSMLIGMSAAATINVKEVKDVLTIPVNALQESEDRVFVYTEIDESGGLSGEVDVTTGLSDGTQVEVLSGLGEGDMVYYVRVTNNNSNNSFGGSSMPNFVGGAPSFNGGGGGMPIIRQAR